MAAKAPSLAEALTSGFLTCSICLERLRQPKILPCLHTYCHPCLKKLAAGRKKDLQCPECRQSVPLPPGGVDGLKTNFFINGLLDLVCPAGKAQPTCSPCRLIGQSANRVAVSRCLDCADDLCQACTGGHHCSRLTHAHCVVDMESYLSGEYNEEIRKRQASRCKEHAGEELRFFCTPCAAPLCRECRLGPHLQHPCLSLAEAAEARRPIIAGLLVGVEETVQRIQRGRASLEEELRVLEAHGVAVREAVERTCSRVVAQLLAQQEEVLAQLSEGLEERKKALKVLRSELEFQEQVASSTVAFAQKVLSLGREPEIVSLEQLISERLRQLQDFSWEPLAIRLPQLEICSDLQSSRSLLHLAFREGKQALRRPEEEKDQKEKAREGKEREERATNGGARKQQQPVPLLGPEPQALPSPFVTSRETLGPEGPPGGGPGSRVEAPLPPPKGTEAPPLLPKPTFLCSFWAKTSTDKKRPRVTGLCPYGCGEILVADEQNRKLKRFSLQGDFKGTVPVPSEVAPFSVAAVGSKVAFTAGSQLYLLNGEGALVWQKALKRGQASHALTAVGGDRLAVSVARHLEVYNLEGRLVERIVPEGTQERCLVFLASRKQGFVGSDWYRQSVVLFGGEGDLVAECRKEQLSECQPGAVCVDAVGTVYVVLREQNKVVAFSEKGEVLGPFLTADNSLDRPRVATVAGDGRFVVALSNGTVHVFKIRYQRKSR
ncbi:LOW QUALITY PROTEIN: E3 ubiquitin-protein ligase TRIM56 [Pogona vitticeps]